MLSVGFAKHFDLQGVSQRWSSLLHASLPYLFARHWGLELAAGRPRSDDFFYQATVAAFARLHPVSRADSIQAGSIRLAQNAVTDPGTKQLTQGVSLRYGLSTQQLKQANNLISEASIYSRDTLFIPVREAAELAGQVRRLRAASASRPAHEGCISSPECSIQVVRFVACPRSRKEFAVLVNGAERERALKVSPCVQRCHGGFPSASPLLGFFTKHAGGLGPAAAATAGGGYRHRR